MQEQQTIRAIPVEQAETAPKQKRNKLLIILMLVVLLAGLGSYSYWKLVASKHVTTNNAYAAADIAHVTPSTGGTIQKILVIDTQAVNAGDVLITLDRTDAELALKEAEANLQRSLADLDRAEMNYNRRQKLVASGFVSDEEMNHVQSSLKIAKANVDLAKAALEKTRVELDRTVIRAPATGIIAKREVQLGQRVAPGTYLLSIVPINEIYVNANFKEVQLRKVQVGQPVLVHADLYGSKVTYRGEVVGLSGGTGAAFALIPAQNATGNWIKVVQRLPVRIKLNEEDLRRHPLKVGLSMNVDIDVG